MPRWLAYAPTWPLFVWEYCHHGLWFDVLAFMKVNPALKYGCVVLDSKFDRYRLFAHRPMMVPTALLAARDPRDAASLARLLEQARIGFPVVVKPDLSFGNRDIARLDSVAELAAYLSTRSYDCLVQPFVDAPREFSVYYYRLPGQTGGAILDLTERVLPRVVGDGRHSIDALIASRPEWAHIAAVVRGHSPGVDQDQVPPPGATVQLRLAAGRDQGALFVDSQHLCTPALVRCFDELVEGTGFFAGKFDVKVDSREALARGHRLRILEVNGPVSSLNSTNDPRCGYVEALRRVAAQYGVIFAIASRNRAHRTPRLHDVLARLARLLRHLHALGKC